MSNEQDLEKRVRMLEQDVADILTRLDRLEHYDIPEIEEALQRLRSRVIYEKGY